MAAADRALVSSRVVKPKPACSTGVLSLIKAKKFPVMVFEIPCRLTARNAGEIR
ncbi:hypothetical protein [Oleomonas cavernae]|uniref:hypothetical protein n=1 Tax=Oleomonas cavernae TaxID=2320859 RepID=UPI001314AC2B|nr:hypothetical protein [Oleomonas cavernae]